MSCLDNRTYKRQLRYLDLAARFTSLMGEMSRKPAAGLISVLSDYALHS